MIDVDGLEKAAGGDPAVKVSVSKKWLAEVAKELRELEGYRTRQKSYSYMDETLNSIFGKRGKR